MKDKAPVGADLYIENSSGNLESPRGSGHKTIVFTNSINFGLPGPRAHSWEEVEWLVLQEFKEWKEMAHQKKGFSGA